MQDYPPQDGSYWWAVVFCDECGSEGPPTRASSKTEAESDAEIAWNDRAARTPTPGSGAGDDDRVECVSCDGAGSFARCRAVNASGDRCMLPLNPGHRYHHTDNSGWPEPEQRS